MIKLLYYASKALSILPDFLEAIGKKEMLIESIESIPDHEETGKDPDKAAVTFSSRLGEKIVFLFQYRPGEEGTRGSTDKLIFIDFFDGRKNNWTFAYIEHHCWCRHCKGLKYPFSPINYDTNRSFEDIPELDRLNIIRAYLAGPQISPRVYQV